MMFEHSSKNKTGLLIISSVILAIGLLLLLISPIIFQEGDPWPQIKGIAQLSFGGADMVIISDTKNKYMTSSKSGAETVKTFMKEKGYEFTDQMGSGYFFKSSEGVSIIVTRRSYSRYYALWSIMQ